MDEFRTRPTLIARVRDRADTASWQEFYLFYQPLIVRYLRHQGLEEDAAGDVVQDVFTQLLRTLPDFTLGRKPGRFRNYLWRVTFITLVNQARRMKRRKSAEEEWIRRFRAANESESQKLIKELDEMECLHRLATAMQRVRTTTASGSWVCFEQRVLNQRPAAAIAAELEISANAVFVYASRVLKAVRAECAAIAEELGDDSVHGLPEDF